MASGKRDHDIVLFGATGFTGALTAEYLAGAIPEGTSWALAGRNRAKLGALRGRLSFREGAGEPDLLEADVTDLPSLRRVAEGARVVITTVGPYIHYGDPLVAACAEAGTDYVDLTGEPEFVDRCYVRHHARAVESGARLVHACGFDSIPTDLGALFTVGQLPEGVPLKVAGFVRAGGTFSGGTYQSALAAMSRVRKTAAAASERKNAEPRPDGGRQARGVKGLPRHEGAVDAWVLPLPTIDPQVVLRSARALDAYGPDFSYSHYVAVKRLPLAVGGVAGVAALAGLAQVPPARKFLEGRFKSGHGPSPGQRAKAWFNIRFVGEGGGRRVVCEVSGGDPGYGETSKMLSEAALCLAHDDLPQTAGQVTTAQAMGEALTGRLQSAGIGFTTI
ncbi:MAG: saccharopine dehydrogenase family protein [Thermoleophilaceae bacterium]